MPDRIGVVCGPRDCGAVRLCHATSHVTVRSVRGRVERVYRGVRMAVVGCRFVYRRPISRHSGTMGVRRLAALPHGRPVHPARTHDERTISHVSVSHIHSTMHRGPRARGIASARSHATLSLEQSSTLNTLRFPYHLGREHSENTHPAWWPQKAPQTSSSPYTMQQHT